MIVSEVKTQATWDDWIKTVPHTPFTQAWDWGVFYLSQGYKVWHLVVRAGDQTHPGEPLILTQVARVPLRFGFTYLLSAYGPIILDTQQATAATQALEQFIRQLAQQNKSIFWRAEPSEPPSEHWHKVADRQPSRTWILDLSQSEEELLKHLHPKTRYNIKLAERKGVTVRFGKNAAAMDGFINCIQQTYERHDIKSFPESYYRTQLATVPWEQLAVAEFGGHVIAANLLTTFGDTLTYVHGGSLTAHKELMAPHLLQWQTILEARKRGCRWYDFFGIAPDNAPDHPWAGITRFKRGFGGEALERPGTFELPLKGLGYTLFVGAKRFRV